MSEYAVEVRNLSWKYQRSEDFVLKGIDLRIPKGSFTLVVGPNEAGKTTLMLAIKGLIPHSIPGSLRGSVLVFGEPVENMSAPVLAQRVGYVFSDPEAQFTALTVEDELLFGLENIGIPEEEISARILWASNVTMIRDLLDKRPHDLSGGQKQRVAIASVLAMRPDILILDEPTSMIDPLGRDVIVSICSELKKSGELTMIVVEHNIEAFVDIADQIVLLNGGRIIKSAPPQEFFEDIDLLLRNHVYPPQVAHLFWLLRQRQIYAGPLPLTDEEGVIAGRRLLRGSG